MSDTSLVIDDIQVMLFQPGSARDGSATAQGQPECSRAHPCDGWRILNLVLWFSQRHLTDGL